MIRPLWNVNKGTKSSSSLGGSQTNVRKASAFLFCIDLHFTKLCGLQEAIVNTLLARMATINSCSVLCLDQKDKMTLATAFSLPPQDGKMIQFYDKKCVFSTGSVIVDISDELMKIT